MTDNQNRWLDWGFKIISAFIVPLIGYTLWLHSTIAVQENNLAAQSAQIVELKQDMKKVRDNEVALVRLESKMESANEKLDDIKVALQNLP